jgi:hypothetical protein
LQLRKRLGEELFVPRGQWEPDSRLNLLRMEVLPAADPKVSENNSA